MEQEMVSSPTRPPRYHPLFSIKDANNEGVRFFTHAFRTAYAANYWIEAILTACTDVTTTNWKDEQTLVFTHPDTGFTLTIREYHLEDLIEYTPTKEEREWIPPYPDSHQLSTLTQFWTQPTLPSWQPEEPVEPKPKQKPKTQNRHRSQKPAPEGSVTVAILAAEYQIPANKARQILRKNNIKKPEGGWTFKNGDPLIKTIRDLFSKSS